MSEGIQYAGEFSIATCELITSSGLHVNLRDSVLSITLFENLKNPMLTGSINIQDSFSLPSIGPLIGQEYLALKIMTPSIEDDDKVLDFTENVFHIYKIGARQSAGEGIQVHTLNFISSEALKNERTRISRTLTGSQDEIVKQMLSDVNYKKNMFIEPSSTSKKYISPNLNPFKIIDMCKFESTTKHNGSPTYLFYENFNGYHYRSIESLYAQSPKWKYYKSPPGAAQITKNTPLHNIKKELENIVDYQIVPNNDTLTNTGSGMLNSKLLVHDIFNKRYTSHTYNMLEANKDEKHINAYHNAGDYPIYSKTPVEPNKKISDFTANIYLKPTSIKNTTTNSNAMHTSSTGTYPFQGNDPQNWFQRRVSQMMQLETGLQVNIETLGNTVVTVGDIVDLSLPVKAAVESPEFADGIDKLYRGKFLVQRIRHDFEIGGNAQSHTTVLTLVKDSVETEFEAPEDNTEPKPIKDGIIETEFYVEGGVA